MSLLVTSLNPHYSSLPRSFFIQHEPVVVAENFQSFKMYDGDTWWVRIDDSLDRKKAELVELHKTEDIGIFEVVLVVGSKSMNAGLFSVTKYLEPFTF